MKLKKLVIVFTLAALIVIGSGIFMNTAAYDIPSSEESELQDTVLTIVTRHDIVITTEFEARFLETPEAIALGITDIDFKQATTDEGWKTLLQDPSRGIDLAWGGGPSLFNTMEKWGLLKHIDDVTLKDYINSQVPDTLGGAAMKSVDESDNLIWIANAISSFGFTVNHDFLDTYGLDVPHTWQELADPTYYLGGGVNAISMGDPPLTTSNTRIYQIILQAFGWEKGWSIMTRMAANAGIYPGSVDTRAATVTGEVGIAMTIDFYGVIANRENPSCEYIVPEGQSIVNGDPIAMGINVDDEDAAEAFLKYLFSPEGQAVWLTERLDRLPVNEDAFSTPFGQDKTYLYGIFNATLETEGIDFNETLATQTLDTTIYYFKKTISEEHSKLQKVWGEMITQLTDATIDLATYQKYVEDLGKIGMTLEQAIEWNDQYQTDKDFAALKDSEWRNFAKNKYNELYYNLTGTYLFTTESPFLFTPVIFSVLFVATIVYVVRKKRK